jgi:type I restriction enzyme S subunit
LTRREEVLVRDLVLRGEAELTTGPFGTQLKAAEYVEEGIPLINVRNIGFGETWETNLEYLSEETARRLDRHRLAAGDIVFGRKGAVERHAFVSDAQAGWVQGSDCLRLRLRTPCFEPRFVSYFLLTEHHKQWMRNHCSGGATMASLNQDILGRIALPVVPPATQRKIAATLSAYDDLIENNSCRIKVLEEMAQRIHREWFVDFRYPGHERLPLVESDLGAIPEGWEYQALGTVADLRWGDTTKTKASYSESGYDAYSAAGRNGKMPSFDFDRDGVVLSAIGANCGKTWLAKGKWSCIKNTIRLFPATSLAGAEYLYLATRSETFWPKRGAAQPFISQADARSARILLPTEAVARSFERIATAIYDEIERSRLANAVLKDTRDLLLPRLISGQIDVTDLDIDGLDLGVT